MDTQSKARDLSRSQLRRREDILEAALIIFDRDGFEAAKMADIAREAEVAKGTLYLYFDTKQALLEGVVTTAILPTLQQIGYTAQSQEGTAKERLSHQVRIAAKRMASPEMKTLLRHMIASAPKHQEITKFYYDNVVLKGIEHFQATLDQGIESGEFRADLRGIDPVVLVGAPVYSAVWSILFSDMAAIDAEQAAEDFLAIVLRGIMTGT